MTQTESNSLLKKLEEFKQLGNQEFVKLKNDGDLNKRAITYYQLAIQYYNDKQQQQVKEDEIKIKKLMSIIYSNLSLCYINACEIDKALESTIKGIEFDNDNSKCHYRKSLCNQYMCNFKESLISINNALLAINKSSTTTIDKSLKLLIENEKIEIEKKLKKQKQEEIECQQRIKEDYEQFQQFPIELVWREGFGRCVLASEDLPKGTMVLRVSPFASVLEDHKIFKNCGFCFKKVSKSSGGGGENNERIEGICKNCNNYLLCKNCLNNEYAIKYHKEECDILAFLKEYYPSVETRDFRFMFRVLLNVIKDREQGGGSNGFNKESMSKTWLNSELPFIFDSYKYLINLSRTLDKVEPEQMEAFQRSTSSIIAVFDKLRGGDYFSKYGISEQEIIEIYSIVLSNGHEMLHPLNCHTYGLGIFPTGSYLNHSCLPNAFWYNDDQGMMVFRTLRTIKKGEELLTSYTDITTECIDRRKHLLKQYFFFCQCQQCKYQSTLTDQICNKCNKPLSKSQLTYQSPTSNDNDSGFNYLCSNCNSISKEIDTSLNPSFYFTNKHDQKTFKKINLLLNIMQKRHYSIVNNIKNTNNEYLMKGMPDYLVYKEITLALENSMIGNPSKINSDQVFTNSLIQYYFRLFQTLKREKPNDTQQLQSIKTKILQLLTPIIHLSSSHHKTSIEKKLKF